MSLRVTKTEYVNHDLTLDAEPLCGAKLVPPEPGQTLFVECPKCEAVITRQLELLARIAP